MSIIRKLAHEEMEAFVDIAANAYPGFMQQAPEFKQKVKDNFNRIQEEDGSIDYYGLFRQDKLVGGMRIHHYTMNLLSQKIQVGGVGLVAVDLLHKKEQVAKELIQYFIRYFREKGVSLVLLYPFRTDFYKQMGFGYGTKMDQYELLPTSFPRGVSKKNIGFVTKEDQQLVVDCYQRFSSQTHGMLDKTDSDLNSLFKNPENKIVAYRQKDKIEGYLVFTYRKASETNFILNHLVVKEFIYENSQAFSELCTFLHSQADQFNRIILTTQDDSFHFVLSDSRNGSQNLIPTVYHESHTSGNGLMYRVINLEGIFKVLRNHNFGQVTARVRFDIRDTFVEENSYAITVHFENGVGSVIQHGDYDVEVSMDISDFSSLLMCAVDFKSLYRYGLAHISHVDDVPLINQLFATYDKPVCMTGF